MMKDWSSFITKSNSWSPIMSEKSITTFMNVRSTKRSLTTRSPIWQSFKYVFYQRRNCSLGKFNERKKYLYDNLEIVQQFDSIVQHSIHIAGIMPFFIRLHSFLLEHTIFLLSFQTHPSIRYIWSPSCRMFGVIHYFYVLSGFRILDLNYNTDYYISNKLT